MLNLRRTATLVLTLLFTASLALAAKPQAYTLAELAKNIEKVEKKEIVLKGTIVGACKSGCKMWVAMGDYKDGDLFALVRAKDDAFKFDTNSSGKAVTLKGYAVAEYMDYCAEEAQGGETAKAAKAEKEAGMCKAPVNTDKAAKQAKKVKDITFFATTVEYK
jgi:hypothetical protein